MRRLIAALALMLTSSTAHAEKVKAVHDGDTFSLSGTVTIYKLPLAVRVLGIDTPELWNAKCPEEHAEADKARIFTTELISKAGWAVTLTDVAWDKYGGRIDAHVSVMSNGKLLRLDKALIDADLAVPYFGQGPKRDWCAHLAAKAFSETK